MGASSQSLQSSADTYHPDFATEGDVVLVTAGSVRFRTTSAILRRTSGFFRAMFDHARPDTPSADAHVISIDEDERTMAVVLKIASGLPVGLLTELVDTAVIERIGLAADKYDIPAVLDVLHVMVHAPVLKAHPLLRYAMSTRYGWADSCAEAAIDLLDIELDFENVPPMDMQHFNRLLRLRHRRVSAFAAVLNSSMFSAGNSACCTQLGHALAQPTAWDTLKHYLLLEMTRKPSGASIRFDSACCTAVADATCPTCGENTKLYNWEYTRTKILGTLDGLTKDLA